MRNTGYRRLWLARSERAVWCRGKVPWSSCAFLKEDDDADHPSETEALADWPYLDRVRGLRVALFGGEVREERRVALERAFQLESLDWIPRDRPRLVASLAERSSRGTVDFVLVTKFVSHKETATIQRGKAPMLTMRHGYGVTTVRQVFEEYFSRGDEKRRGAGGTAG